MPFKLTNIQSAATNLMASIATHILLRGGSRSGKTFAIIRAIIIRAKIAPGSRHAILGFRGNRITQAIILDTWPRVLKVCFPDIGGTFDKQRGFHTFPNGSQVFFGGLDDQERSEKILGTEYATIFFNEANQLSAETIQIALTRLAQKVMIKGLDDKTDELSFEREMRLKVFYDCNPPKKSHWIYRRFIKKLDDDGKPLKHPEDYVELKMNPDDNQENLGAGYLASLDNLSASKRRRFKMGEFGEADPNQLFDEDNFEKYRVIDADDLPDMVRIVVGVDPSGADDKNNEDNDAIGIVIAGLGTDGNAYILEDRTVKAGPKTWGKVATDAYEQHDADRIIGEQNYGGAMVKFVIRTANPRVPYSKVTATRGKTVRAEPVAALYQQGKVRHVGYLREMEDEMIGFTTRGYVGEKSPNRGDACVWCIYSLFPALTRHKEESSEPVLDELLDSGVGY